MMSACFLVIEGVEVELLGTHPSSQALEELQRVAAVAAEYQGRTSLLMSASHALKLHHRTQNRDLETSVPLDNRFISFKFQQLR